MSREAISSSARLEHPLRRFGSLLLAREVLDEVLSVYRCGAGSIWLDQAPQDQQRPVARTSLD